MCARHDLKLIDGWRREGIDGSACIRVGRRRVLRRSGVGAGTVGRMRDACKRQNDGKQKSRNRQLLHETSPCAVATPLTEECPAWAKALVSSRQNSISEAVAF